MAYIKSARWCHWIIKSVKYELHRISSDKMVWAGSSSVTKNIIHPEEKTKLKG